MYRQIVNPWSWQDRLGFAQAVEVESATHWLCVAGQSSVDADGRLACPGDMAAQLAAAVDNLHAVLDAAAMRLADVVQLRIFTTDMAAYLTVEPALVKRLDAAACRAARTEIQVEALRHHQLLVTIEALAAR